MTTFLNFQKTLIFNEKISFGFVAGMCKIFF